MDFAIVYVVQRFFYRVLDFFHHWYIDGSRVIAHNFISTLESIDQTVALKITLRHFFEPLYKDYSIIGRILGVVFRTGRVLVGSLFYLFLLILYAIAYITWVAVPIIIIIYGARGI
jgi:hypothetical protein